MTKTKKFLRLEFIFALVCAILTIASIIFSAVCFEKAMVFCGVNAVFCAIAFGADAFALYMMWQAEICKERYHV